MALTIARFNAKFAEPMVAQIIALVQRDIRVALDLVAPKDELVADQG